MSLSRSEKLLQKCDADGKLFNPATDRCVNPKGRVGKKLLQTKTAKKASPAKRVVKKASPKKASPKKASPKKASPKKASPKKVLPKKVLPKKVLPKKVRIHSTGHRRSVQTSSEKSPRKLKAIAKPKASPQRKPKAIAKPKASPQRKVKASPQRKPKARNFVLTVSTFFKRTNHATKEPNPSRKRLDEIVKDRVLPEFRTWILNEPMGYGMFPISSYQKLQAHPGGKITFEVDGVTEDTVKKLVNELNFESLEDGVYEDFPGRGFVVETKPNAKGEIEELGLIDYRGHITYRPID